MFKFLIAFTIALSGAAFAQQSSELDLDLDSTETESAAVVTSEIQSRPAKGQVRLLATPSFFASSRQVDFENSTQEGYSREFSESALEIGADWGVIQAISVGVSSSFGDGTTRRSDRDGSYRFTGMGDINLNLKGRIPVPGNLMLGLESTLSPAKQQLASLRTSGNRYSGGNSITPVVSYEGFLSSNFIAGLTSSYSFYDVRKSETKSSSGSVVDETETTGGNIFAIGPHMEYRDDSFAIGLQQNFRFVGQATETSTSSDTYTYDAMTWSDTSLYSAIQVQDYWEIVPRLGYSTIMNREINGIKYMYYNNFDFKVVSRVTF